MFGGIYSRRLKMDNERIKRLKKWYGKQIIYIAERDIKKGSILEDNDIELYWDGDKRYASNKYNDKVIDIIKLGKPFLGLRAIVNISYEQELKSTLFEDAKLQIERDRKNQMRKEKIKLQIKNNIWL